MRRIPLLPLILCCALAVDAAAQDTPSARRDSIRMAEVEEVDAEVPVGEVDGDDAEADTVPEPAAGPYARGGGTGPFSVQASGQVAPRPERGQVVWVSAAAPRAAARDSARRDTARAGQRVTASQPARRDTASATRPASRDTARTQRAGTNPPARRDTSASTRPPASEPAAERPGSTSTPSRRARSHTVVAGETFYGIARRYGVTAAQLRALNPDVDMDALEVGDGLRLPAGARDSRAAAPPRPAAPATAGGQTQQPRRGTRSHVVQAGETLFGIARRYGVTVDAIQRANRMETDQVRTGERLVIPPAS